MPNRLRAHQIEDLSRNRLHAAFVGVGWTVEDLSKDYGEDLLVRLFETETATPYAFFVQAKATDNVQRLKNLATGRIRFQIKTGHLRHWIRFHEPVFLTMYDSKSDNTHWVCIQSALGEKLSQQLFSQKYLTVEIPESNLLDDDGLLRLRGITRLRFDRIKRERQGAQVLINLLAEKSGIVVDNYDPLNQLIEIRNEDGGKEYIFLGEFAKWLDDCADKARLPTREFIVRAARSFIEKPRTPELQASTRRLVDERTKEVERAAGRIPLID